MVKLIPSLEKTTHFIFLSCRFSFSLNRSIRKLVVATHRRISRPKIKVEEKKIEIEKVVEKEIEVPVEKIVVQEVIKEIPVEKLVIKEVPKEIIRKELVHVPIHSSEEIRLGKQNQETFNVQTSNLWSKNTPENQNKNNFQSVK